MLIEQQPVGNRGKVSQKKHEKKNRMEIQEQEKEEREKEKSKGGTH